MSITDQVIKLLKRKGGIVAGGIIERKLIDFVPQKPGTINRALRELSRDTDKNKKPIVPILRKDKEGPRRSVRYWINKNHPLFG
jgi:hypothetical protein